LIAATDNMPSVTAQRPGGVLRAVNGLTIETGNTDAEGPLTLAAALASAAKEITPDETLDLATLTGAAVIERGLGRSGALATAAGAGGRPGPRAARATACVRLWHPCRRGRASRRIDRDMPGGADLHTQPTASGGTYAPRELVAEAASRGVRVLAVTDHDSTEGLTEAFEEAGRRRPLEVLPGIEINCDVEGAEIHVLGYLMDWQAGWFQDFCREQRRERRERVHRMAEQMTGLGMPFDPDEVFALVKEGSAGRPHVAQVMVKRG